MPRSQTIAKISASKKPRTPSSVVAKKQALSARKPGGVTGVEKKKRRFSSFVSTLRGIRRQQKETKSAHQFRPMVELVKAIVNDFDNKTFLRRSTVKTIEEVVMPHAITVLRQALDRRMESLTPHERKNQRCVQVMEKNIRGAFKVWAESRTGNYLNIYDDTLAAQKQLKE